MSIREYGIYGAFSVPFFIIVGLTGSLLCIWFGKLIENTAPGRFIAYVGKNTIFLLAFHIFALEVVERIASKFIAIPVPGGAVVPFVLYHALRITAAVLVFPVGISTRSDSTWFFDAGVSLTGSVFMKRQGIPGRRRNPKKRYEAVKRL